MLLRDLAIAIRVLSKSPLFTLTAVITIALGLGASTAIFSVTHDVLLRPLPYKEPDRLVIAGMELRQRHVRDLQFSNADYIDFRDGTKSAFEDMGGVFTFRNVIPQEDGTPEEVQHGNRHHQFLSRAGRQDRRRPRLLRRRRSARSRRAIGRTRPPARTTAGTPLPRRMPRIAIISYEYFQRRYGGNAAMLGHTLSAAQANRA